MKLNQFKYGYLLIMVFMIFKVAMVSAQTNEREALKNYKEAQKTFKNSNYTKTIRLLNETKRLLGSTNIRIQPMLIKSYYQVKDYHKAKEEIKIYYNLPNLNKELVEYQEITSIEAKVNSGIYEEKQLYQKLKRTSSVYDFEKYLNNYPYGIHRNEVRKLLSDQKDKNAWANAKSKSTTTSYYEYLDKYPNGIYASTAKSTIERWDREAFEKAKQSKSVTKYESYLRNYTRGKYRNEVERLLKEQKEEDSYNSAMNSSYSNGCENYLRAYPNGKYVSQVSNKLERIYYTEGNTKFNNKRYKDAKKSYEKYIAWFPNGTYSSNVKGKIRACSRKINYQESIPKYGINSMSYFYDVQAPVGLGALWLNPKSIGGYIKANANVSNDIQFAVLDLDDVASGNAVLLSNGETKVGAFNISGGVTYPIIYPLFCYGGLGYSSVTTVQEADRFSNFGVDLGRDWVVVNKERKLSPEFGLSLVVGKVATLSYGVVFRDEMIHQIGIGFDFDNLYDLF